MRDGASDLLRDVADEYWDGTMARAPFVATMFGDHRFDDRVPDLSDDGLAEHRAFARAIAQRAQEIDANGLSAGERVTRALLLDACDTTVEEIDSHEIQLSSDGFTSYPVALLRGASRAPRRSCVVCRTCRRSSTTCGRTGAPAWIGAGPPHRRSSDGPLR